ncbi:hypothetical protein F7Q99_39050 [Streptomyces kaniharaensis]|uniref:Uncharacterized protein n=1 Tax=Streptomyces kaniharaensis TaxID=212423 RepID=A0A6N7L330_9ACTN|nr:hypothetical protein [Streptomyces kaniharaensis]MQS18031.1 hypothetical protein [Streptomyces kaniharaensis]
MSTSSHHEPLTPWEEITPDWSKAALIEYPGSRLKRIMYGTEVGLVPDEAFAADCAAADVRLQELRTADPDDAGVVHAGQTFSAVAAGGSAEDRARAEYYLCDELMEYPLRHGYLWYGEHPALDPELRGRYQQSETGPGPVDSLTAAIIARGAEAAARWDARPEPSL